MQLYFVLHLLLLHADVLLLLQFFHFFELGLGDAKVRVDALVVGAHVVEVAVQDNVFLRDVIEFVLLDVLFDLHDYLVLLELLHLEPEEFGVLLMRQLQLSYLIVDVL